MTVSVKWSALKQSHWYEFILRFVLGGLATVLAGAVAEFWGPEMGGLFLAFPAIFCASATLIERHERERKQKAGLTGEDRGTNAAALDSAGAVLGSVGLAAFGTVTWLFAPTFSVLSLFFASLSWVIVSIVLWRFRRLLRASRVRRTLG
jgi:hypothetical protein